MPTNPRVYSEFMQRLEQASADDKDEILRCIWLTLYPGGDLDHEWSPDELQSIAGIFADADLTPEGEDA